MSIYQIDKNKKYFISTLKKWGMYEFYMKTVRRYCSGKHDGVTNGREFINKYSLANITDWLLWSNDFNIFFKNRFKKPTDNDYTSEMDFQAELNDCNFI